MVAHRAMWHSFAVAALKRVSHVRSNLPSRDRTRALASEGAASLAFPQAVTRPRLDGLREVAPIRPLRADEEDRRQEVSSKLDAWMRKAAAPKVAAL
jgi:hypothetical protein